MRKTANRTPDIERIIVSQSSPKRRSAVEEHASSPHYTIE
jgi:hypothetical protein